MPFFLLYPMVRFSCLYFVFMVQKTALLIGNSISGLTCANRLQENGFRILYYSSSDREVAPSFEYIPLASLGQTNERFPLSAKHPDIWIYRDESFLQLKTPFSPSWKFWFSSFGTLKDRHLFFRWKKQLLRGSLPSSVPYLFYLRERGFSKKAIEHFFQPWLAGFFGDGEGLFSPPWIEEIIAAWFQGPIALLDEKVHPLQLSLAQKLPPPIPTPIQRVQPQAIILRTGEKVVADAILMATSPSQCRQWLLDYPQEEKSSGAILYFQAEQIPIERPTIVLPSAPSSLIHHWTVVNHWEGSGEKDHRLAVVVKPGNFSSEEFITKVGEELQQMIQTSVSFVSARQISATPPLLPFRLRPNLYLCGDPSHVSRVPGANQMGEQVAQAVLEDHFVG